MQDSQLPAIATLDARGASGTLDLNQDGRDRFAQSDGALEIGPSLYLPSSSKQIEWGIWRFEPAAGFLPSSLEIAMSATDEAWIGIADFANQRWQISGPHGAGQTFDLSLGSGGAGGGGSGADYLSPAGSVYCVVLINDVHSAVVQSLQLTVSGNLPPVAAFTATPQTGDPGATVTLDASASSDPEDDALHYEWDLDGDGSFELDNGTDPLAATTLPDPQGSRDIGLRVTDEGGLSSTAAQPVISPATAVGPLQVAASGPYTHVSLALVNGNPAIAYALDIGWESAGHQIYYVRATSPDGSTWGEPVALTGATGTGVQLLVVNGTPAICWLDDWGWFGGEGSGDLRYIRASDADGTTWGEPLTVTPTSATMDYEQFTSMAIIAGHPAIAYCEGDTKYVRAADPAGTSWGTPDVVFIGGKSQGPSLAEVDGRPFVAFYCKWMIDQPLQLCINTTYGFDWWYPEPSVLYDTGGEYFQAGAVLRIVNGNPAITHFAYDSGEVLFFRATVPDGSDWSAPIAVAASANDNLSGAFAVLAGIPTVAFQMQADGLHFLALTKAQDVDGSSWGAASEYRSGALTQQRPNWPGLLEVQGSPAVAYCDRQALWYLKTE